MALYLARAKYSNSAFKGMVDNPQDREAAASKLSSALNVNMEGSAENIAAVEMVTSSTGTFSSFEAIEIIDSKSMTSAMVTANKVVSAYQTPNN